MFSTDLNGYVTSWNRGAELLFGYSATEMVGRFYGEILEGESSETSSRCSPERWMGSA